MTAWPPDDDPVEVTFTVPRTGRDPAEFRNTVIGNIREAVMCAYLYGNLDLDRVNEIYQAIPMAPGRPRR